jgi:hypothetical protein
MISVHIVPTSQLTNAPTVADELNKKDKLARELESTYKEVLNQVSED